MSGPTIARATATDPTHTVQVLRVAPDATAPADDTLAVEEPLEINLNGWRWLVTMRTPGADPDLVLGMLASEGVIARASEVTSILFRRHPEEPDLANVVDVQLERALGDLQERLARNQTLASTSCGLCGASSVASILQRHATLPPGPTVAAEIIAALPPRLGAAQPAFQSTGGLHAAALFSAEGELLAAREDVGRHNAVDKVLGWRLQHAAGATPILLVSGRASFEIVQKALAAAIPIVAAVSAPSSLAVTLAEEAGMTLAGFVRDGRYNVYSGQSRILAASDVASDRDPNASGADPLDFIPRSVRTALDEIALKISLGDWRSLTRGERTRLITLCEHASREDFAAYLVDRVKLRTGEPPRPLADRA